MCIPVRQIYELNPLVAMVECFRVRAVRPALPVVGDFAYFLVWAIALFVLRLVGVLEARTATGGGSMTTPKSRSASPTSRSDTGCTTSEISR